MANYIQIALGSIKQQDFQGEKNSNYFKLACFGSEVRSYFLESMGGFKQLVKFNTSIAKGLALAGVEITPAVKSYLAACKGAQDILVARECFSKFKDIFKPWHVYSIWTEERAGAPSQLFAKAAQIANWMMSVCDTHAWLSKIELVTERTIFKRISVVSSVIYLSHGFHTEAAKWWTGRVIDPLKGDTKEFGYEERISSLFKLTVLTAYAAVTALTIAEMGGAVIAHAAVYNFTLLTAASVFTIMGHFWDQLNKS